MSEVVNIYRAVISSLFQALMNKEPFFVFVGNGKLMVVRVFAATTKVPYFVQTWLRQKTINTLQTTQKRKIILIANNSGSFVLGQIILDIQIAIMSGADSCKEYKSVKTLISYNSKEFKASFVFILFFGTD